MQNKDCQHLLDVEEMLEQLLYLVAYFPKILAIQKELLHF